MHRLVLGVAVLVSSSFLLPASAQARKVEDAHAGEVVILDKRPPDRFRTKSAFAHFLRRHRLRRLWPPKGQAKGWKLEFMAFFARPIGDNEVQVRFYDVTRGRRFVAGDRIYTSSRSQRILGSNMELESPPFQVGRRYLMYVLNARNVVLATAKFDLGGKVERYSGKVTFTEDEANK